MHERELREFPADILVGTLLEESWLTLEQMALACRVETDWLLYHIDEGLLPGAERVAGIWRLSAASLQRVRRMRELERDFDAVPELAALVADLLEEMDELRRIANRPSRRG
ncbi:chaperone modulator CbpM [Propionivibrio limicola]|uniref:chaperone modulator CbpM n=1 Tax=Propionivibrio limicola TaxID=167645 RepID=UPI00129110D5|nr:chaperone modulator CbpM [Propionivibrio limicola]